MLKFYKINVLSNINFLYIQNFIDPEVNHTIIAYIKQLFFLIIIQIILDFFFDDLWTNLILVSPVMNQIFCYLTVQAILFIHWAINNVVKSYFYALCMLYSVTESTFSVFFVICSTFSTACHTLLILESCKFFQYCRSTQSLCNLLKCWITFKF